MSACLDQGQLIKVWFIDGLGCHKKGGRSLIPGQSVQNGSCIFRRAVVKRQADIPSIQRGSRLHRQPVIGNGGFFLRGMRHIVRQKERSKA